MNDYCYCDPGETPAFYGKSTPKARASHKCTECGRLIAPGESYERVTGKWDGRLDTFKTCCRCVALRTHIQAHVPCFCWEHGNLLENFRDEVENLPAAAYGSGLLFEIGRLAVAIKRAPKFSGATP